MRETMGTIAAFVAVVISLGGLIFSMGILARRVQEHEKRLDKVEGAQKEDHDKLTAIGPTLEAMAKQINFLWQKAQNPRRRTNDA